MTLQHYRIIPALPKAHYLAFIALLLVCLVASACGSPTPVVTEAADPTDSVQEPPLDTETPPVKDPISAFTPVVPRLFFVLPPGNDVSLVADVESALNEFSVQEGFSLEVVQSLSPEQLIEDVQMVVSLPPDPGLAEMAAAAQDVRFLAIEIPDLVQASNLTTIYLPENRPDQQGFIAGVIAALVTPDWRVGVISNSDTDEGVAARTGFMNGVTYFCGTCRQIYPPFIDSENQLIQYPIFIELPSGSTAEAWRSAADYLISRSVQTIYVYPGVADESLLVYLAQAGIRLVGGTPPTEKLTENWVASVMLNPSLSLFSLIENAYQNQVMEGISASLQIEHVNPQILSPGRLQLANSILDELLSGHIETSDIDEEQELP